MVPTGRTSASLAPTVTDVFRWYSLVSVPFQNLSTNSKFLSEMLCAAVAPLAKPAPDFVSRALRMVEQKKRWAAIKKAS